MDKETNKRPIMEQDLGKQAAIERSPTLKALLDESAASDPYMWNEIVNSKSTLPPDVDAATYNEKVDGIHNAVILFRAFPESVDDETRETVVRGLLSAGYEIGDEDDARRLLPDIIDHLKDAQLLSLSCALAGQDVADFVWFALSKGIELRGPKEEMPTEFTDFVANMKL